MTTPSVEVPAPQRRPRNPVTALYWLVPAAVAITFDSLVISRAPLWRDELATWQFARLGWGDLARATEHGDRVQLPYYALMHVVDAVTPGLVALRLPSVLAGVAAVVFTALVAARLWSRTAGFLAGLALAVNGSLVALSVEARPGMLAVAGCAASTWALLRALDPHRSGRSDWVLFGLLVAFAAAMQPFAVLVLAAQALLLGADRPRWTRFVGSAVPAVVIAGTLLASSYGQRGQISWIPDPSFEKVRDVLTRVGGGSASSLLVVVAALIVLGAWRTDADPRGQVPQRSLALGLALLPVVGLLVVSVAVHPVFVGRYLSAVPLGFALLLGAAGHELVRRGPQVVIATGVALVVVLGTLPGLSVAFRTTRGDDFPQLVKLLERTVAPGDRVVVYQASPTSGFLAGLAAYSPDSQLRTDLDAELGVGLPAYNWRAVDRATPFSTHAVSPWDLHGSTWYVAREGRDHHALGLAPLRTRGCRPGYERHVDRAVFVRLNCPS